MKLRFRFSLATFLVLVALLAAGTAWHVKRAERYQGRTELKNYLARHTCRFFLTVAEVDPEIPPLPPRDTSPPASLLYEWDRYWFGEDAVTQYEALAVINPISIVRTAGHDPELLARLAELPRVFPELRFVSYSSGNISAGLGEMFFEQPLRTPFDRDWSEGDWDRLKQLRNIVASLPQLEIVFYKPRGAEIDDEWVAQLPERSPLRLVDSTNWKLTPRGLQELIRKCPNFMFYQFLNSEALDHDSVAALNATLPDWERRRREYFGFYLTPPNWADGPNKTWEEKRQLLELQGEGHRRDVRKRNKLTIKVTDPRQKSLPLNPSVAEVRVPYHLLCVRAEWPHPDAQKPAAEPLEFVGGSAASLEVWNWENVTFRSWPNLKRVRFHDTKNITFVDCDNAPTWTAP